MSLRGLRTRPRLGASLRMEGRAKTNGGKLAFVGSGGGTGCPGSASRGASNIQRVKCKWVAGAQLNGDGASLAAVSL